IDTKAKLIDIQVKGERFPIEFIFDKFRNPHLSNIFGASDCSGTFKGWGKKFEAKVSGTTYDGGWNKITAPVIKTELSATYNKLTLDNTIISEERETGTSHLEIAFGPKVKGQLRHKDVTLKAKLDNHPMETSLQAYGLKGNGSGTVKFVGPSQAIKGEAFAKIRNGSWKNINFERASAKIDISRRKLLFHDLDLALLRIPTDTSGEIVADISPGQVHFYGAPIPDLNLDLYYMSHAKRWKIKDISWNKADKNQNAIVNGSISADGPVDLQIKGHAELAVFKPFLSFIRGGNGPIDVDLNVRGHAQNPQLFGSIKFNKNYLTLRNVQLVLENLTGSLKFNGHKVSFEDIVATSEDGSLKLKGWFEHAELKPKFADISLVGDAMRYRTKDREFNIEFEGALALKGAFPQPHLSGNIIILDGKYTRDFNIIDKLTADRSEELPAKKGGIDDLFDPKLDLHVQNSGDLEIKNNVGEIYLSANVDIKGTRKKPIVSGSITSNEGKIDYLGILFEINKGFIEFRADYEKPYVELHGQRELGVYNINIVLHGPTDNLTLDLSATSPSGPLEKRDVVSLMLFGMTENERDYYTSNDRGDMTTSLVAKSVTSVVERPVTKYTHLDVFRLEASDPDKSHVSRLYVGKQLSDRLSINFATDINTDEAEQTVIAEYLITDNLLIRGARSTDQKSEFSGLLRFRIR
ncbi:MAG: hypothetical protein HN337_08775, partial [Deltaproteobacteria bacterium]|nr:hypothetical protein [Deltaproteobacteria bacterium]